MHQPIADCESETQAVDYSYLHDLIGHLLGLAHVRVSQLCTEVMEPLELTPKQFVALEFIANNPCMSQKSIADHIGTAPAVMVGILDKLSTRGLVRRVRAKEDRRQHYVQLTPSGEASLAEIRRLAFEVERLFAVESGLSTSERETVLRLLRKMTGS